MVVGTVEPNPAREGRPLFNSALWLESGQIRHAFRKRLLPTYDVFDEDRYFEPTQELNLVSWGDRQLGFTICEDIWNDRDFWQHRRYAIDPVEEMAQAGVDVLVNLSASPFSVGKPGLRSQMIGSMACKHHLPIAYVNQVGGNDDLIFDGSSFVCDREGRTAMRGAAFDSDIVLVDLDAMTGTEAEWPTEAIAELYQALVLGTRDYARKCGFKRALLGLSGGIDSAVTAAIAVAALGAENVLGVLMPSPYSSPGSIEDAKALAETLGMKTQMLAIAPVMAAFDRVLAEPFAELAPDMTEENIQSRIRGNLLMALSNKFGRLLLTTGNKSELAVGYCTIYGDMSGGLAVIADVPKTQVYTLARWLNRDRPCIPISTLTKPPSAELRPEQKDTDSLPDYGILDEILTRHIEHHDSLDDLVRAGFDRAIVARILKLVAIAEFKRHQAPPGL
ncbi:MAG: NAD+ synthase, partial [Cyanobacteria bacterium J06648_11]